MLYISYPNHILTVDNSTLASLSEQTLGKIGKRVWEIGWGRNVPCARNAGALPIGS